MLIDNSNNKAFNQSRVRAIAQQISWKRQGLRTLKRGCETLPDSGLGTTDGAGASLFNCNSICDSTEDIASLSLESLRRSPGVATVANRTASTTSTAASNSAADANHAARPPVLMARDLCRTTAVHSLMRYAPSCTKLVPNAPARANKRRINACISAFWRVPQYYKATQIAN